MNPLPEDLGAGAGALALAFGVTEGSGFGFALDERFFAGTAVETGGAVSFGVSAAGMTVWFTRFGAFAGTGSVAVGGIAAGSDFRPTVSDE